MGQNTGMNRAFLLCLLLATAACRTNPYTGRLQAHGFSEEHMNSLGEKSYAEMTGPESETRLVTDPRYLIEPLIMHAHFKKIPDVAGWDPTTCRANEPR